MTSFNGIEVHVVPGCGVKIVRHGFHTVTKPLYTSLSKGHGV